MGFTQASVLGLIVVAAASVHTSYTPPELQGRQSTNDPTDFGWIKKWAAIGDSFTAGTSCRILICDWQLTEYNNRNRLWTPAGKQAVARQGMGMFSI